LLWSYHQKPTLTQVNVIVSDEGILFPDVTVCNNNPVMQSKASGKRLAWFDGLRMLL
jgi:hypothetical protein